jgi:nicotinate-nucleotide adenylyltransferase
MRMVRGYPNAPRLLGILPGTFHPPTCAHLALAEAALTVVDQVLFVLPETLPHKRYEAVGLAQRLEMLQAAVPQRDGFAIGVSNNGLFREIAEECRALYPEPCRLHLVCGRDAAERILNWDYGDPDFVPAMLGEFHLLVAHREGPFEPPARYAEAIRCVSLETEYDGISASEIRRRIAAGEPWQHLTPASIIPLVERYYGAVAR